MHTIASKSEEEVQVCDVPTPGLAPKKDKVNIDVARAMPVDRYIARRPTPHGQRVRKDRRFVHWKARQTYVHQKDRLQKRV